MKILFVMAHLGKGGGQQTQAIRLINEISKHHDSLLVTLSYPSTIIEPPSQTVYAGSLRFPRGVFDIFRFVKEHADDFDIIQVLDPYYGLPAVWVSRRRPYVMRIGMNPILDLKYRKKHVSASINSVILPSMLKSSAGVVVNSRHFLEEFARYHPIFIPNGYDFQSLLTPLSQYECKERLGFPTDRFLLLYTGKVIPRKNLEIVLDIMRSLDNLMFVVVGNTNEPLYGDRYYRELCSGYKDIMDRVIFTGELPMWEMKYVLKSCDAYVFPSLLEGCPNSVLEAMVVGLPVVCSDIPSHKEIIEHDKNGMLFSDRMELMNCISRLLDDRATAKRVGIAGKRYVTQYHDIVTVAEKYITLYEEILG